MHLVGNPALVQLRERAEMWLESWTAGKSEPTQISRGGAGLSLKGIRPVSGSFRGRAQGRAQDRRFVIRSEGGGSQKPGGEDHNPPFQFAPAPFGFFVLVPRRSGSDRFTRRLWPDQRVADTHGRAFREHGRL